MIVITHTQFKIQIKGTVSALHNALLNFVPKKLVNKSIATLLSRNESKDISMHTYQGTNKNRLQAASCSNDGEE